MITHGRGYLFGLDEGKVNKTFIEKDYPHAAEDGEGYE